MNAVSSIYTAPWYVIMDLLQTVLMFPTLIAYFGTTAFVKRSRARYWASTALRTLIIPMTVLSTVKLIVSYAVEEWFSVASCALILFSMPFYFRNADNDEDDWWTGRGTKIRKALKTAFAPPAASTNTAGA